MERRHDLDLVRITAFFLLMVYHASLMFGSRQFVIKSVESTPFFDIVHLLTHPWRMTLLFFISGAATAFALEKQRPGELRSRRSRQLLLPFLIGMVVLIPPQVHAFLTVVDGRSITMLEVFQGYLTLSPFELSDGSREVFLSMQHLWYLVYLWIYTVIMTTLVALWRGRLDRFADWLAARLKGPALILWPLLFFVLLRATVKPFFPHRLDIAQDWYSHIRYLSCFAGGVLLGGRADFWHELAKVRRAGLVGVLTCVPILLMMISVTPLADRATWNSPFASLVVGSFMWCAMVAILGYAQMFGSFRHPVVSYLNKAVLTYYVLHQTLMVIIAKWLHSIGFLRVSSFVPIVLLTLIACALVYEAWRRLRHIVPRVQLA
jgi:hypothetical protein